jgi:PAS domain S-box-containing protein
MIRNPEELIQPIKEAVDRKAVVFSHVLIAFTITLHTLLDPRSLGYQIAIAIGMSVGAVILALFRFFDLARLNSKPRLYLGFYYVLIFAGFTFVSDPATPYIAGFFLVVILSNLYYGGVGVRSVVVMLAVASVIKYFFLLATIGLTTTDKLNIVVTFLIFWAVCSIFVNIQKVYDWDYTRLKSMTRGATIGQKRLRTLINSMTESVLVLDKNGFVRLYNAAALALFDTNNSLEGKRPADFAKMEDEKGNEITINDLLPDSPNPLARNDIVLRYSKEDTAALSLTVTPLRTSFGQGDNYTGYILTMRDITREKSLEEERNEFISVISHELRTPVTVTEASLSNALILHDKHGGDEEVKKTLVTAHDQAIYLANMLNDLSTFARAEKGTLELNLEEISPGDLVVQLENEFHNEAEVKGLHVESKVIDGLPENLVSNRLYIREILHNFITNGIKYSDTGTITISVQPLEDGSIMFSVSDQGIGISVGDQKKVFNKFFRSEDYRTRSRNGTGLGLYIVRKLAKLLQAKISMTSELGKGSTFNLKVPDLRELMKSHTHEPHQATNPSPELKAAEVEDKGETIPVTIDAERMVSPTGLKETGEFPDDIEGEVSENKAEQPIPKEPTTTDRTAVHHRHARAYHLHKQR